MTTRHDPEEFVFDQGWSAAETEALSTAVHRAPSVHNVQPWTLEVGARTAVLRQRPEATLAHHDPRGRDVSISCGAALAHLIIAIRAWGWAIDIRSPFDDRVDVIAEVRAAQRQDPSPTEARRYAAIASRASHRSPFGAALTAEQQDQLHDSASVPQVHAHWISDGDEARLLARNLGYAARIHHDNQGYQRELGAWMSAWASGVDEEPQGQGTGLPSVGLVTARTRVPDERRLADWIERESVLVLSALADDRGHHRQVGEAMESAWLDATSVGLAASVMTQPLHVDEVRAELAAGLELGGLPCVIMRFGYPP